MFSSWKYKFFPNKGDIKGIRDLTMKKILALIVLVVFAASVWAQAASAVRNTAFAMQGEMKKIISGPCIMSYTDTRGEIFMVIRSNILVIYVK